MKVPVRRKAHAALAVAALAQLALLGSARRSTGGDEKTRAPGVAEDVARDVLALPKEDRPFARYFTLSHLAPSGSSDDEIASWRAGLAEIVASLSWKKKVVAPAAVGEARTVFRVDLREQGWTAETWKTIVSRYPYGLAHASEAARETGSELPWVRADWFVWAALRQPLYGEVLGLPGSDRELEKLLGIDAAANREKGAAPRAGFRRSGECASSATTEARSSSLSRTVSRLT
ncbi:hypothetical protein HY251_02240 [bacterium]|nr:hypothetical protein [bacterium]